MNEMELSFAEILILSQARLPIPPQGQAGGIIVGNGVGSTLCVAVPTQ
jgi:hypothetical protein